MQTAEFEAAYRCHYEPLRRFARRLVRDYGLAEEIAQDALLKLWQRGDALTSEPKSWLFTVAKHRAVDHLRLKRPSVQLGLDADATAQAGESPEVAYERRLLSADLEAAAQMLTQRQRQMLALRYGHGLPYGEIAQVLGYPLGTVKSGLSNAHAAMRRHLRRRWSA